MNFYKLAQLSDIEIFEDIKDHSESYMGIGHGEYFEGRGGKPYNEENPNYMWIFNNGEVMVEEETPKLPGHALAFPGHDYRYGGRFESATGKLSIKRPVGSAWEHRPVPNGILFKLYQKFPGVKQIYVF